MPRALSRRQIEMFLRPNFGCLATLMPDGSPQVTPLWVDHRDGLIWINTQNDRVKPRNMNRDGRVAITVTDQADPYRWVQARGRVVEVTTEGADEHIRDLQQKYHGNRDYPFKAGTQRLIFKIEPTSVSASVR